MKYSEISSEEDLKKFLKETAKKRHWWTDTEVIPDRCKKWDNPWRADLILEHPDYGRIGVELKYSEKQLKGKTLTKAINQVLKYSKETYYNGKKVPLWAIGYKQGSKENTTFSKSLLNSLGIGKINIREWSQYGGILITFNNNLPTHKAPLGIFEREDIKKRYKEQAKKQKEEILDNHSDNYDRKQVHKYCEKKKKEKSQFWGKK